MSISRTFARAESVQKAYIFRKEATVVFGFAPLPGLSFALHLLDEAGRVGNRSRLRMLHVHIRVKLVQHVHVAVGQVGTLVQVAIVDRLRDGGDRARMVQRNPQHIGELRFCQCALKGKGDCKSMDTYIWKHTNRFGGGKELGDSLGVRHMCLEAVQPVLLGQSLQLVSVLQGERFLCYRDQPGVTVCDRNVASQGKFAGIVDIQRVEQGNV